MKITNEQGRDIYQLATDPSQKITNAEIGKRFGISESSVRRIVTKNEKMFHEIAKSNDKVAGALADHAINVTGEAAAILDAIKTSIKEAKVAGVSPEKLSGLYNNWIRGLETLSELLGDIDRAPVLNVQISSQFHELKSVIIGELCPACKAKVKGRLHEIISN